jgi:hypothetical protein
MTINKIYEKTTEENIGYKLKFVFPSYLYLFLDKNLHNQKTNGE